MEPAGLTLDTGALIALERRERRMTLVFATAKADDLPVTVPAAVLVEWLRGHPSRRLPLPSLLARVKVEPLSLRLARLAGEALAGMPDKVSVVDAVVMASAAQRGDAVYTSDIPDLQSLQQCFPNVRLFKT
jgi:predicted nucleic acid-binding protein